MIILKIKYGNNVLSIIRPKFYFGGNNKEGILIPYLYQIKYTVSPEEFQSDLGLLLESQNNHVLR